MPQTVAEALLAWYDRCKRKLPWRETGDPYAIWISETMLQQTRVETVIPYYQRFLAAFPTLQALADAPEEAVLKHWEGLGYYQRARNLQKGARQVLAQYGGSLPRDAALLRDVCGIGPYTAGAIASIAFSLPEPAVDGNVIRVVSRLDDMRENTGIPSVKRALTDRIRSLIPPERPGDFNQALMDLGSRICTPGTPDCEACPLRTFCRAFAEGDPASLPYLPDKAPPRVISYNLLIITDAQGRVLLRPRTEKLLEGLWCFPLTEDEPETAAAKLLHAPFRVTGTAGHARHVFTHRVWEMELVTVSADCPAPAGWRFCTAEEVEALPMPTAVRAARALVTAAR